MTKRWICSILLVSYWSALLVLTHLPHAGPLAPSAQHDEIMHGLAYAVLAMLLATTWQLSSGALSLAQLGWAWCALLLYAALDEWTQSFVGRQMSFTDWIADAIGALLGLALFAWLRERIA